MTQSIKERVYAAADQISEERTPTVSAVRELAAVSMADASRHLKDWKEEYAAATSQVMATPPAIVDQAVKLAGSVWAEASRLATAQHAEVQAAWEARKAEMENELAELVESADASDAAHKAENERLVRELATAQATAQTATEAVEASRRETADAAKEASELRTKLAATQATAATLQAAHDALVARIPQPSARARKAPATETGAHARA